jgi:SAM-dependent methyltransferase
VGCGDGTFLRAAREKGWQVAGTELRGALPASDEIPVWPSLFGNTRKTGRPAPLGSAELLPYMAAQEGAPLCAPLGIEQRFDCVTAWHVFEHLIDPLESAREMKRLLAPDGALLLAVPDSGGWQARLSGRFWFHLDVPRHLFHFDLGSLRRLLDDAGFEVVGVWHHELEYDLFGWIQSALNAMLEMPNVLFDALTGRTRRTGRLPLLWSLAFAVLALPIAFVLTVISTLARRGGTLIVAARPRG